MKNQVIPGLLAAGAHRAARAAVAAQPCLDNFAAREFIELKLIDERSQRGAVFAGGRGVGLPARIPALEAEGCGGRGGLVLVEKIQQQLRLDIIVAGGSEVVLEPSRELVGFRERAALEGGFRQPQDRAEFFHLDPDGMHPVFHALREGVNVPGHSRHEAAQNPLNIPARAVGGKKGWAHASTE